MKLLSKNEIGKEKTRERQLEIEEGAKLAKKVDNLRKLSLEEEARIQKFRLASIQETNRQIEEQTKKRDVLKSEVEVLEERKRVAQIPLTEEWNKIGETYAMIDGVAIRNNQRSIELASEEAIINARQKDIALAEDQINDLGQRVLDELVQADSKHREADKDRRDAKKIREEAEEFSKNWQEEIVGRELDLSARERSYENKKESVIKKEDELNKRERAIKDRYETLLRTEKRLQKHGDKHRSNPRI